MRTVEVSQAVNANIKVIKSVDLDAVPEDLGRNGVIPVAARPYVTAVEKGDPSGLIHQTVLTLAALPQAIADANSWMGTEIYDFPEGRLSILGCTAAIAPTTTSAIATTIKSGVGGVVGLGTVAASKIAIDTTSVDLLPSTVTVNGTVINVAAAAVKAALAAAAQFDGTTTAKKMFLNSSVAAVDIDGDGTLTWSGTITITWINLGDY